MSIIKRVFSWVVNPPQIWYDYQAWKFGRTLCKPLVDAAEGVE